MNGANGKNKDESSFGKRDKTFDNRQGADIPENKESDGSDATSNAGGNAKNEKSSDSQVGSVFIDDKKQEWKKDKIEANEVFDIASKSRSPLEELKMMVAIYVDREEPFKKDEDKSFNIEECNRFEVDCSAEGRFDEKIGGTGFYCLHYRSNRKLSRHQFGRIKNVINRGSNQCVLFFPLIINKDHEIKDNLIFFGINGGIDDVASMKTKICKSLRISPETDELQIYTTAHCVAVDYWLA